MAAMPTFKQRSERLTTRLVVLLAPFVLLIIFGFAHFGQVGRGRSAALMTITIVAAIRLFWDLRRRLWFWPVMSIITGAHISLLFSIAWDNGSYPSPLLVPDLVIDISAVYFGVRMIEKLTTKNADA
jgi:hypothetical protein